MSPTLASERIILEIELFWNFKKKRSYKNVNTITIRFKIITIVFNFMMKVIAKFSTKISKKTS